MPTGNKLDFSELEPQRQQFVQEGTRSEMLDEGSNPAKLSSLTGDVFSTLILLFLISLYGEQQS